MLIWIALATAGGFILFLAGAAVASQHGAQMDHQAMIDARSADAMPFDLNETQHLFRKTNDGGDESVVAIDAQERHGHARSSRPCNRLQSSTGCLR